jgi:hypothetical protein
MYNFAKFVDRQAQTFDGPVRPIVFCVLRQTPLSAALRDALSRKVVDHRPLEFPLSPTPSRRASAMSSLAVRRTGNICARF